MRKTMLILLSLCGCSMAMGAETALTGPAVQALLSDRILVANIDGKMIEQIFQKSGLTLYSENRAQSQGFWKVEANAYCSQWPPNETWSCFEVFQDGNNVTFVSKSGRRFPMELKNP